MKMRHTDSVEIRFIGPASNLAKATQAMKNLGFINSSETVPWREAFPEYESRELPGMILSGARLREDLTQAQLAEMTGIPQGHISEMENGKRPIGKKHAHLFAKALNCGYKVFL
jgi:DNA-binding XRE family transcriptional regulator